MMCVRNLLFKDDFCSYVAEEEEDEGEGEGEGEDEEDDA
jgi:hypothetical protein